VPALGGSRCSEWKVGDPEATDIYSYRGRLTTIGCQTAHDAHFTLTNLQALPLFRRLVNRI
jgi:hypothetical protein